MTRIKELENIAAEASIAAAENCRCAPDLIFPGVYKVLRSRLDSSVTVFYDRWFAWHPVRLKNGRLAWLRHVERRTEIAAGWSEKWIERSYSA